MRPPASIRCWSSTKRMNRTQPRASCRNSSRRSAVIGSALSPVALRDRLARDGFHRTICRCFTSEGRGRRAKQLCAPPDELAFAGADLDSHSPGLPFCFHSLSVNDKRRAPRAVAQFPPQGDSCCCCGAVVTCLGIHLQRLFTPLAVCGDLINITRYTNPSTLAPLGAPILTSLPVRRAKFPHWKTGPIVGCVAGDC